MTVTAGLPASSVSSVSSVCKALTILEMLASADGRAIGVTDLAQVAEMPKSTTHRLLKDMEEHGFIGRVGSKYRIGSRCLHLGAVARWSAYGRLIERAAPAIEWLFERTGETVHLAVLDGGDALYLEKVNGRGGCLMRTKVGMGVRAETTAVGRTLLSSAPVFCADAVQPEFVGIATPVRLLADGAVIAGLSVDGSASRINPEVLGPAVREAATRISRRLGLSVERGGQEPATRRS